MNLKRPVALLVLATTTTACMATYRVQPAQYIPQSHPDQILVLDDIGSLHVVQQPAIVGDNLVGIEAGTPDTLSLPVSQLTDAIVQRKSPARTAFLVGGLTFGVALATAGIIYEGTHNPCQSAANKKDNASPTGTSQCVTTLADGAN